MAHLKARLQFPLHSLFSDIYKYYDIQLEKLMSNVIQTTVGFIMACRAYGCEVSLELWRRLYYLSHKCTMEEGKGFFYITRRGQQSNITGPSSVHSWKNEYFYVKHPSFKKSGILVPWNTQKCLNNDLREGCCQDAQDVVTLVSF